MDIKVKFLLNIKGGKTSPVSNSYRQAYSDRTALLMALLSNLAYLRFNPSPDLNKIIQDTIFKLLNEKSLCWTKKRKLEKMRNFYSQMDYDEKEEEKQLNDNLTEIGFKLVKAFDCNGTQAILCSSDDKYLILAFRGTEKTSFRDIKADCKASMIPCESGGKVHKGFAEYYGNVKDAIHQELAKFNTDGNKPLLFITGHSLGGALATIATKDIESFYCNGVGACYTFGSPRTVSPEWLSTVKTPIYRIVNAADCVTMLPPSWGFVYATSHLIKLIPWSIGEKLGTAYLEKFGDYLHAGDMRYLSSCTAGDYDDVQLLPNVSLMWRLRNWLRKGLITKALKDHSIDIYCNKLHIIAKRRNLVKKTVP